MPNVQYTRLDDDGLLYLLQLLKPQIEAAGVITVIQKNGTALPITNKTVNILVPTNSDIQTIVESYGYQTQQDVATAIEAAIVGALQPKGSVAFANLPALTAANLNTFYNVTDDFTSTIDFTDGGGKSYPAGTNVAIINNGTAANPVYKYDAMTGVIDLSGYVQASEMHALTNAEIDTIFQQVFGS